MSWARIALQVPAYAAFAAFIGYFSTDPAYRHLDAGEAVVKLSLVHAGERLHECRSRSPEELAKLAPNMRAQLDCPRERSAVRVEVDMDGQPLFRVEAPARGLRRDLASVVFRRHDVPAGAHVFRARLADGPRGEFTHATEMRVELAPGRVLVIDYTDGEFRFHA